MGLEGDWYGIDAVLKYQISRMSAPYYLTDRLMKSASKGSILCLLSSLLEGHVSILFDTTYLVSVLFCYSILLHLQVVSYFLMSTWRQSLITRYVLHCVIPCYIIVLFSLF